MSHCTPKKKSRNPNQSTSRPTLTDPHRSSERRRSPTLSFSSENAGVLAGLKGQASADRLISTKSTGRIVHDRAMVRGFSFFSGCLGRVSQQLLLNWTLSNQAANLGGRILPRFCAILGSLVNSFNRWTLKVCCFLIKIFLTVDFSEDVCLFICMGPSAQTLSVLLQLLQNSTKSEARRIVV